MPHQCTNCGRGFDDGSTEMLSGCPDCGGNKFQYQPESADLSGSPDPDAEPPEPPQADSSVARTVGKTAATVRDIVGGGSSQRSETPSTEVGSTAPGSEASGSDAASADIEDAAQASARGDVVEPEELPSVSEQSADTEQRFRSTDQDSPESSERDDRPDLQELREELNDQFESIKVLEPGQYELNLMELYDREEYIVALQEDGRYSIQVPESLRSE